MKLRTALFSVILMGLYMAGSPAALAQAWMAGTSVGMAKQYKYEVGGPIENSDETDTAFRVFGGYQFHPNFAAVISYVDLGSGKYDGPAFGGFTDELEADGVDASFVAGFAPGEQKLFRWFFTVGAFRWNQDVHYVDTSGDYRYKDSGTSLSFSTGGEIALDDSGHWGLHVNWQRFLNVGDKTNSGHEYTRDMVSVGFEYRFGK